MRLLQNNIFVFAGALVIFGFSGASFLNLSSAPIDNHGQAVWTVFAISLTLAGLLVSPLLALRAVSVIFKLMIQPALKHKRKRDT
jgi:hypothetical protein